MIGSTLGPYQVLSKLGEGGMGEVYRARDSKLKRDVAIKVLPEAFAKDPERLARFEREAEVLATLNHPNIAAVYGFEESADANGIVLELVEGPTLADRIARGPVPVEEVLPIARQIADALEAAHDRGVVHRDLKPANIKITNDGQVKVLDFGLAKMLEGDTSDPRQINVTASPTMMSPAMTGLGMILGTAAYMSPEQASARPTDKRADIWSYGVILWEMLTGQRLFDAETVSHTLADVLRAPIDLTKLPAATPPSIRELVGRCLERDVKNRLRDIGEARVAIDRALSGKSPVSVAPAGRSSRVAAIVAGAVAAAALVAAAGLAFVHFREQPVTPPQMRFHVAAPAQAVLDGPMVISPDGRTFAFAAAGLDGRPQLWLRDVDGLTARQLPGTDGAVRGAFWSPDSRALGFAVEISGRRLIKRIDVGTSVVQTLGSYAGNFRGGAWGPDGTILFTSSLSAGVMRLSQAGGAMTPVTELDRGRQETQHSVPVFLPDGRRFLYFRSSARADSAGLYVGSLDTPAAQQSSTRLIAATAGVAYVDNPRTGGGWILFQRQNVLLAQSVDSRLAIVGDPQLLADDVGSVGTYGRFSASANMLAYRNGGNGAGLAELRWVERNGKPSGTLGPGGEDIGTAGTVQLSADGRRVATTRPDLDASARVGATQGARAWIADTSRGIFSRVSTEAGTESSPAITPDGHVIFSSTADGALGDLYWTQANGIGKAEPLLTKSPTVKHPNGVSHDGRFLIFDDHSVQQRQDLYVLRLDVPPGTAKPIPFLVTPADETFGQFSPDGKWIAYSSDESGRREVYVQGFAPDRVPAASVGKFQISTAGGDKPRWRADGKELYYLAPDSKMMAVSVKSTATSFDPGIAMPLFSARVVGFFPYDVAPDGRFLLAAVEDSGAAANESPVTIALNWQAMLKK